KIAVIRTMIPTITEVIQVSFHVVQVILRASARTSRRNWKGPTRGLRSASGVRAAEPGVAGVRKGVLRRIAVCTMPWSLAMGPINSLSSGTGRLWPRLDHIVAGVEGLEPPALGFGDRCSTS